MCVHAPTCVWCALGGVSFWPSQVSFVIPLTPVATERIDPTRYHNCVVLIVVSNDRARLSLCTALSSAYVVWKLCSLQVSGDPQKYFRASTHTPFQGYQKQRHR